MSGKLHQDIHKSEYQQHIRAVRREDYNKRKQKQLIVVNGGARADFAASAVPVFSAARDFCTVRRFLLWPHAFASPLRWL